MRLRECEVIYRTRTVDCDLGKRASARAVTSSADIFAILGPLAQNRAYESVWAVLLDARNRVTGVHEVARGGVSSVGVSMADIFRAAIVTNAHAVILAHNHPSGECDPSADDLALTERAREAGELLGVRVLDHVIFGSAGYLSMLDSGCFPFRSKGKD